MPLCPADCGRQFETDRGLNQHLNNSVSCSWYRTYQKTAAIENFTAQLDEEELGEDWMQREIDGEQPAEITNEQAGELLQEFEEDNDVFHFVRVDDPPEIGEAGPGPATQAHHEQMADRQLGTKVRSLDDGDLRMFEQEHATAGCLVRMDTSLRERWCVAHGIPFDVPMDGSGPQSSSLYALFASEMDWWIAEWFVKDNIGHNSFNRLLQILGVSSLGLLLSLLC
jgi:hypothetical protein